MDIFTLSESAALLEMSKSTVTNWTIGRPLKFSPTVRRATGTGTRNLYSREDLYLFSLAKHLSDFGFSTKTIQRVLDEFAGLGRSLGGPHNISWLLIDRDRTGKRIDPVLIPQAVPWPRIAATSKEESVDRYFCDFSRVRASIDERISNLSDPVRKRRRAK